MKQTLSSRQAISVIFLALILLLIGGVIGWQLKARGNINPQILEVYNLLQSEYNNDIDETKMIKALIASLDNPYSYYLDQETYERIQEENKGNYKGIGILYSFQNSKLIVTEVFPDSPAQKAGLKSGYEIFTINGQPVSKMENVFEISKILRGNSQGGVRLNDITITKGSFYIPNITFRELENNIGYLKIYRFGSNLEKELQAITTKKLVIDLRNNTGGNTEKSLWFTDQFLPEGVISKEKLWDDPLKENKSKSGDQFENIELVVLINKETSSAAETVAAALRDNNRAKLIGEKTYGKSTVGSTYELSDGSAIHLSIGEWFRSNGESINGNGVKPDIEVEDKDDQILQAALNLLSS
ncbi:MAG: Peptidase S41A [Candidatus Woesebacteria bacterium GW2011_GWB1_38_5b]|uniref:Peptidase S41A n=1 Tax=Candidatus Woesebacteria bacterium GW2011_GWB1_38_5b TaxID=1618569 RepID=A0A0G0K9F6_9BACT|nr:MAG: Peptidase S41A [Candidatus Woesebacteria bacterium GW2011_GWB1_38_5b]